MDLESESSAHESVEDNGLIGDKFVFASNLVEAGKDEKQTIDVVKQPETSTPASKGQGLRKWRRIRRDLVKDTSLNSDSGKILKRGLSGSGHSLAKQMHLQSPDMRQDSLGSASSVNMLKNTGLASLETKLEGVIAFSAGMDSENSEDRSSRSSTAASGPKARYDKTMGHSWNKQQAKYVSGKTLTSSGEIGEQGRSRIENSKKLRGERIIIEKENSHSSMDSSDSRSSNFVFMQGASYTSKKQGGKVMDYNEENSDDAHTDGETPNQKDNNTGEESKNKNNGSSENLDPLTEAFKGFLTLQEALEKEVLKFQELGKEPMLLHGDKHVELERASEASSSHQFGTENIAQEGLNLEHLEMKLEETKSMLEVKDAHIRGLESTINLNKPSRGATRSISEMEIEEIFQQKMESEIEYLIFSKSVENLNKQINMIGEQTTLSENQAHKMLFKLGEAETKAENLKNQAQDLQKHYVEITEPQEVQSLKKRAFKTSSCLILQLALLLLVVMLFISEPLQKSEIVVPT